jgi:Ni/Co efflux regulator RcnB
MYHGHAFHQFRGWRYDWPHGYSYRLLAIGAILPAAFLIDEYYINNYADYQLDAPPPGYHWTRYGSDILLVNSDTGEISQNIQGAFDDSGAAESSNGQ